MEMSFTSVHDYSFFETCCRTKTYVSEKDNLQSYILAILMSHLFREISAYSVSLVEMSLNFCREKKLFVASVCRAKP